MKFAKKADEETITNAWSTWKAICHGARVTLDEFRAKVAATDAVTMAVEELLALEPVNLGATRMSGRTPEEAYPLGDRPRGDEDIRTVRKLMRMRRAISPAIFMRAKNGRLFLLDGVHRIVAANIKKARVSVVILQN